MRSNPPNAATSHAIARSLERPRVPYLLLIALAFAIANVAAVVLSLVGE